VNADRKMVEERQAAAAAAGGFGGFSLPRHHPHCSPRDLSKLAFYDVASNIRKAPRHYPHFRPSFSELIGIQ